jgi:glycosyltransferase involved in cell wall biosynthesis
MIEPRSFEMLTQHRIAIFVSSFRGGGAEGAMVQLANELVTRDLEVDFVVLQDTGPWREKVRPSVRIIDLQASRVALSIKPLVRYFKSFSPDIFLSNVTHLNIAAVVACRLSGTNCRLMLLEHNDLRQRLQHFFKPFERRIFPTLMRITYPHADRILAVSRGVAEGVAATLKISPDSIDIIPNGIDIQHIREQAREDVEHPWLRGNEIPVIMSAGRLVSQKGYADLIHGFALLTEKIPARLIILGEGPLRKELETLKDMLSISENVDLLGFQSNPFAFMSRADLFVLSSLYEGFGIVLLEAMACGTPVVSTDCQSGPREVLNGGEAGLLVSVGNPRELADSMFRVLTDNSFATQLRRAGTKQAEIYSIDTITDRFLALVS